MREGRRRARNRLEVFEIHRGSAAEWLSATGPNPGSPISFARQGHIPTGSQASCLAARPRRYCLNKLVVVSCLGVSTHGGKKVGIPQRGVPWWLRACTSCPPHFCAWASVLARCPSIASCTYHGMVSTTASHKVIIGAGEDAVELIPWLCAVPTSFWCRPSCACPFTLPSLTVVHCLSLSHLVFGVLKAIVCNSGLLRPSSP